MNRGDFQRLADERLSEAQLLLAAGKWAGAYYVAGYAVECALKACILVRIEREGMIFDERDFGSRCATANITEMLALANIKTQFDGRFRASPEFRKHWTAVVNWSKASRYYFSSQDDAEALVTAISHPMEGVLPWIKQNW